MTMMPDSASELAARHCEDYPAGTPTVPSEEAQRLLETERWRMASSRSL